MLKQKVVADESETFATTRASIRSGDVMTRASIRSGDEIFTWTGEKTIQRKSGVRVAFSSAYSAYIPSGVYFCDVYTISAITPENSNVIYRRAIDDECGFMPAASSQTVVQRGTQVLQSDTSEDSYVLKTVCYKIISTIGGATPSGNLYIPCAPEDALLKYKLIEL